MSKRTCSVEGCNDPVKGKGFCQTHYNSWRRHGDLLGSRRKAAKSQSCAVADCNNVVAAKGMCNAHYIRQLKYGDPLAGGPIRARKAIRKFDHPLYSIWRAMLQRCYNERNARYSSYGARGIQVCERWRKDFWAFVSDMGSKPTPAHSIERIDNDGDYEPGNCCWATIVEQSRNMQSNHYITAFGRTQILSDWATETGIPNRTISMRKRGWADEDAVSHWDRIRIRRQS